MSTNASTITGFRVRKRKTASALGFTIVFLVMLVCMVTNYASIEVYNFVLIVAFSSALLGALSGEPRKR